MTSIRIILSLPLMIKYPPISYREKCPLCNLSPSRRFLALCSNVFHTMFIQCWHHGNKKPGPSILTREADGNFNSPLIRNKYVPCIPSSLTLLHPLPDSTHEECNWPTQQTTSASSWWWTSSLGPMWAKRHRFDCRKWNIHQTCCSDLTFPEV